jgi:hypothetical protein
MRYLNVHEISISQRGWKNNWRSKHSPLGKESEMIISIGQRWKYSRIVGSMYVVVCYPHLVSQSGLNPSGTFLGSFAKWRKENISFMSVCPSVCMEQLGSHWTDFDETWYLGLFRKSVEKIQISLKSDKNNVYFTWRRLNIFDDISLNSS